MAAQGRLHRPRPDKLVMCMHCPCSHHGWEDYRYQRSTLQAGRHCVTHLPDKKSAMGPVLTGQASQ